MVRPASVAYRGGQVTVTGPITAAWRSPMDLGRIGIWSPQLWGERARVMEAAAELEELAGGVLSLQT